MASLDNDAHSDPESITDNFELQDEDGWEDAEDDSEEIQIISLFDDATFRNVDGMLQHCKEKHGFEFLRLVKDFDLDFYGKIKLVNFIRSQVKDGNTEPVINSKEDFSDDKYLQPVLEDDALLFSLDEIAADGKPGDEEAPTQNGAGIIHDQSGQIHALEAELSNLKSQFANYRLAVSATLDERWNGPPLPTNNPTSSLSAGPSQLPSVSEAPNHKNDDDDDDGYFSSYSSNEIHQTMLQDRIRTDAYRDFIYTNKRLFAGKTVLDLGCGTGILSLFCARAGAARVLAVDNAAGVVAKARAIVYANNGGGGGNGVITVLRGRIEEVVLPVATVDVIVSEWMGYGLLYEAMLDSVLWARDRYLCPGGLMVPSHATLRIAPVADPDWVAGNVSFWRDVYGFDMQVMMEKVHEDVLVRRVEPEAVVGDSVVFKALPLHTARRDDLTFVEKFGVQLDRDVDALDGWVVWFDTFFLTSPDAAISEEARAEEWGAKPDGSNAFTTGPYGKETHWQSAFMAVDHVKSTGQPLKKGQQINGSVGYRRRQDNDRELDIAISWDVASSAEKGSQVFIMR